MTGTLYGIGVGPGDPELITFKAARLIKACPVVAYPAPEGGKGMARTIASAHFGRNKIEIPMAMTYGLDRISALKAYEKGAASMASHLANGLDVAVLCEGDPLLFGSFIYVMERLSGTFPVVVVPGVSSVTAGGAALKAVLAHGDEVFTVIPATNDKAAIKAALEASDSAVILKLGRHMVKVCAVLEEMGLKDKAKFVEHVSMPSQLVRTIDEAEAEGAPYFSLILVRK